MTVKILTDHLKEVSSVYSGRHGCACGCRGNHTSVKKMIVGIASTAVALRATACGSSTAATPAPHYNDGGSFMPAYIAQVQAPPKNHACEPTTLADLFVPSCDRPESEGAGR